MTSVMYNIIITAVAKDNASRERRNIYIVNATIKSEEHNSEVGFIQYLEHL